MAFELHPPPRWIRDDKRLVARVSHYGALTFSSGAVHKFGLGDWVLCRLLYDKERKVLGVELVARVA